MTSDVVPVIVIVVLLILAAMTVMAECAIGRIGRAKAHHLAQEHRSQGAELLVKLVEDPAPFSNALLLVTLLCHLLGTAIATGIAVARTETVPEIIAAGVMTFAVFVAAEIVPRTFAVQRSERVALVAARPVYVIGKLLKPLGSLLVRVGPFPRDRLLRKKNSVRPSVVPTRRRRSKRKSAS